MLRSALALLAPPLCAACSRAAPAGESLCPRCAAALGLARPAPVAVAGTDWALAAAPYERLAGPLVAALKFRGRIALAAPIAATLATAAGALLEGATLVPAGGAAPAPAPRLRPRRGDRAGAGARHGPSARRLPAARRRAAPGRPDPPRAPRIAAAGEGAGAGPGARGPGRRRGHHRCHPGRLRGRAPRRRQPRDRSPRVRPLGRPPMGRMRAASEPPRVRPGAARHARGGFESALRP